MMKNQKKLLSIAAAFVLLLGGAYVLYHQLGQQMTTQQMAAQPQPTDGQEPQTVPAPDFTAVDREGREVKLSQYFGKPIVLNFWASWCGPCQSEMPDFHEKYQELGDDVHFVMVNMTDGGRETVESASAFIDRHAYSFPVLFDTQAQASSAYGAYSLPTSFFINAEGHVVAQAVGAIDGATLQKGIDMITTDKL